jgi:hypothetical protein
MFSTLYPLKNNLISVHCFTLDNATFIEFHPLFLLIKDQKTLKVLLHGPCRGNLYPLPSSTSKFWKLVFSAIKIPIDRWHSRLGHPSRDIVHRVITKNNIPCSHFDSLIQLVCHACACAKLTNYLILFHRVGHLLLWSLCFLMFGVRPLILLVKKNYVSFIDGYSKFTWIYLLHHKYKVSKYFLEYQSLVERMLGHKIISLQSDWGGKYVMRTSLHMMTLLLLFKDP